MNHGDERIMQSDDGDLIARLEAAAKVRRTAAKKRDCPDGNRLRMLVPGLVDGIEAQELLEHAADCGWCGKVLHEAVQDLGAPFTLKEPGIPGSSYHGHTGRRHEPARELSREARRGALIQWRWPMAVVFAAATLLGGVAYQRCVSGLCRTATMLNRPSANPVRWMCA